MRKMVREEGLTRSLREFGALPQIFDLPISARELASSNLLGFSSLLWRHFLAILRYLKRRMLSAKMVREEGLEPPTYWV